MKIALLIVARDTIAAVWKHATRDRPAELVTLAKADAAEARLLDRAWATRNTPLTGSNADMAAWLDRAEQRIRAEFEAMPDGPWPGPGGHEPRLCSVPVCDLQEGIWCQNHCRHCVPMGPCIRHDKAFLKVIEGWTAQ